MALVSTRSFTAILLLPSIEVVIVVDGFVAGGSRQAADDRVEDEYAGEDDDDRPERGQLLDQAVLSIHPRAVPL